MSLKLKKIFEKEYGRKKGDRIFYAWENKRGEHYPRNNLTKKKELLMGMKIEREHSHLFPKRTRNIMVKKITKDHIKEFPHYYSRGLIPMERKLRKLKGGKL